MKQVVLLISLDVFLSTEYHVKLISPGLVDSVRSSESTELVIDKLSLKV